MGDDGPNKDNQVMNHLKIIYSLICVNFICSGLLIFNWIYSDSLINKSNTASGSSEHIPDIEKIHHMTYDVEGAVNDVYERSKTRRTERSSNKMFLRGRAEISQVCQSIQQCRIRGLKGDKGDRGYTGTTGMMGLQGPRGPPGQNGSKGEKGKRGLLGFPGTIGEKGETGARGIEGAPGFAGPIGARGPRGPKGSIGEKGDKGARGLIGFTGYKGDKGDRGEKGLMLTGKQGTKGEKGEKGHCPATMENWKLANPILESIPEPTLNNRSMRPRSTGGADKQISGAPSSTTKCASAVDNITTLLVFLYLLDGMYR